MPFILLFFVQTAYGIDLTGKEIEACITVEYNRTVNYMAGVSAVGGIELNGVCKLRSGVSIGKSADSTEINAFLGGGYSPFSKAPVVFSLAYIYNGLPEYEAHAHSLLPFISYNAKRAGISLGVNFRFTSFFGEPAQFESIISSRAYFNIINNEMFRIGVSAGNFNDFYAKNMGAYSLNINTVIRFNDNWQIINDFELLQSGGDGLSVTFYGFRWHGGAKFTW